MMTHLFDIVYGIGGLIAMIVIVGAPFMVPTRKKITRSA